MQKMPTVVAIIAFGLVGLMQYWNWSEIDGLHGHDGYLESELEELQDQLEELQELADDQKKEITLLKEQNEVLLEAISYVKEIVDIYHP